MIKIYFIILANIRIENREIDVYRLTEDVVARWPIGFTKTKEEAIKLAKKNLDDPLVNINMDYNTAIIEDIPEGVFQLEKSSLVLFKEEDDNYIELSKKNILVDSWDREEGNDEDTMEYYAYMF